MRFWTWTFAAMVVAVVVVMMGGHKRDQLRDEARRQEVLQQEVLQQESVRLEQQFQGDIEQARLATTDPCAAMFYQLVVPPAGLNKPAQLIMMGKELHHDFDTMLLRQLKADDGRVELWEMDFSRMVNVKIGEKFPLGSPQCLDR